MLNYMPHLAHGSTSTRWEDAAVQAGLPITESVPKLTTAAITSVRFPILGKGNEWTCSEMAPGPKKPSG
jgi:hypothetical protein